MVCESLRQAMTRLSALTLMAWPLLRVGFSIFGDFASTHPATNMIRPYHGRNILTHLRGNNQLHGSPSALQNHNEKGEKEKIMPHPKILLLATVAALAACALPEDGGQPGSVASATLGATPVGLRGADRPFVTSLGTRSEGMPPNARPGQCFIRPTIPAVVSQVPERRLIRAASTQVSTMPAEFRTVEDRVVTQPATRRIEVIEAEYADRTETVVTRPASTRLEPVEATFRTVTERVEVRPARQVWRISSELSPEQRVAAGVAADALDIYCLVTEPAEYRDVTRQVVATPATTRVVQIPAETGTVTRRVLVRPASTRAVEIPAEYGTVTRQVLVSPARSTSSVVPAEYDTITREVVRAPARTEWRQVLCDTNSTPAMLGSIQAALRNAGFDPGRGDGVVDNATLNALRAYQGARNLPVDQDRVINMQTVNSLGLRV